MNGGPSQSARVLIDAHSRGPFSPRLRDVAQTDFTRLCRYWNDPAYRRRMDAETQRARDLQNAAIDKGMAALNQEKVRRWKQQGEVK